MPLISSNGMLVKRDSTSRLPMKNSQNFSEKTNRSFKVYSLLVNDFKLGIKNFANLLVRVLTADKIGGNGGQLSTLHLSTLQSPYIIPGLVPTGVEIFLFLDISY